MTDGRAIRTAVLFDFGGTLDAEGVAWKERFFRLWCEETGETANAQFTSLFYKVDDALVGAVPATLSLRETVERIARGVARELAHPDPLIGERIAKRFLDEAWERLRASAALLGELSRRYRVGIVSNFYGNLGTVCAEAGLAPYLTVAVDSACVGCVKPDPRIFREALKAVKAEPAEAVFVGDSLSRDMAGAKAVGMPHVWLTSETARGEGSCCPDDRVIHSLAELRGLL